MKSMNKQIVSLLVLTSCATGQQVESLKGLEKKTLEDEVSVSVVLLQAHAAYIRGCLIERHLQGYKKSFKYCKKKADAYLESDVKSILKQ